MPLSARTNSSRRRTFASTCEHACRSPDDEPLPNLDNPAIRKLTWEHVVPDRPVQSAPSAATTVPLPPPSRVPPPLPPRPAMPPQPPPPGASSRSSRSKRRSTSSSTTRRRVDDDESSSTTTSRGSIRARCCEEAAVEPHAAPPSRSTEVNRLASVPDLFDDEDESPIELPPITPSGPGPVVVVQPPVLYAPVLAENFYIPPPQRPATTTVAAIVAEGKTAGAKSPETEAKPAADASSPFVLLFGLLGGGAFAAEKYLLHEPTWSAEIKPLADDVAAARGLQFTGAVTWRNSRRPPTQRAWRPRRSAQMSTLRRRGERSGC